MAKEDTKLKDLEKRLATLEKMKIGTKLDKLEKIVEALVTSLKDPKLFKAQGLLDEEAVNKLIIASAKRETEKIQKDTLRMLKDSKVEARIATLEGMVTGLMVSSDRKR